MHSQSLLELPNIVRGSALTRCRVLHTAVSAIEGKIIDGMKVTRTYHSNNNSTDPTKETCVLRIDMMQIVYTRAPTR